jgi:O-methyltransferase
MKTVVFGAGAYGRRYIENCPPDVEIVAVCDNNWEKREGGDTLFGHRILPPGAIPDLEFDRVLIAIRCRRQGDVSVIIEIYQQLVSLGVTDDRILLPPDDESGCEMLQSPEKYPRVQFLRDFSSVVYSRRIAGAVAECGVGFGDFSSHISRFFPDRKLYLFDTFNGFPEIDFQHETENVRVKLRETNDSGFWKASHPSIARLKIPYRRNLVILQGYIPDTFAEVPKEQFVFVSIDVDMYQPTLASLRFFGDKMASEGILLLHDYFCYNGFHSGVIQALREFREEQEISIVPIGDGASVAIAIHKMQ